ncbi:MAG: hypothetical protein ACM3RX_00810 [Methanococcaceae archaeon]
MTTFLNPTDIVNILDSLISAKDSLQSHNIRSYIIESSTTNYMTVISVLSGAIAALAALLSIILTYKIHKSDRDSKRPYFTISSPGFKPMSGLLRLQITFLNIGVHPAKYFKGEIRIFQEDLENESKLPIDVVNDITSNSPTPYYNDSVRLGNNMPKHFIYCKINYFDPLLNKNFEQEFYMKWDGVTNGFTHPDFVHVNTTECEKMNSYLTQKA